MVKANLLSYLYHNGDGDGDGEVDGDGDGEVDGDGFLAMW